MRRSAAPACLIAYFILRRRHAPFPAWASMLTQV
jgi:hypothetical protein